VHVCVETKTNEICLSKTAMNCCSCVVDLFCSIFLSSVVRAINICSLAWTTDRFVFSPSTAMILVWWVLTGVSRCTTISPDPSRAWLWVSTASTYSRSDKTETSSRSWSWMTSGWRRKLPKHERRFRRPRCVSHSVKALVDVIELQEYFDLSKNLWGPWRIELAF